MSAKIMPWLNMPDNDLRRWHGDMLVVIPLNAFAKPIRATRILRESSNNSIIAMRNIGIPVSPIMRLRAGEICRYLYLVVDQVDIDGVNLVVLIKCEARDDRAQLVAFPLLPWLCKKRTYKTQDRAEQARRMMLQKYWMRDGFKMSGGSYRCPECGYWHVTTKLRKYRISGVYKIAPKAYR